MLSVNLILRRAVKRINYIMGPEGLVRSWHVFVNLPLLPVTNEPFPSQKKLTAAIASRHAEMEKTTVLPSIAQALKSKFPDVHNSTIKLAIRYPCLKKKRNNGEY